MKKILPILIVLIAVAGSGFAAMKIRGGGGKPEKVAIAEDGTVHKVHDEEKKGDSAYFKFQRDFIVPVMRGKRVDSIVLLSLTLEMEEDSVEGARLLEPKLRDSFMKALLSLSHDGYFAGDITSPEVYETMQDRLKDAGKAVLDNNIYSVLVVDFARQDQ